MSQLMLFKKKAELYIFSSLLHLASFLTLVWFTSVNYVSLFPRNKLHELPFSPVCFPTFLKTLTGHGSKWQKKS